MLSNIFVMLMVMCRALTRKGNALVKLNRLGEAIEIYKKALVEHRNPDTLKRLNDVTPSHVDSDTDFCAD